MPVEQPPISRETFIALRARRTAYRVATDFIYEQPIDVSTIRCPTCGASFTLRIDHAMNPVGCARCGTELPIPPHLRHLIVPATGYELPRHWPEWFPIHLSDRSVEGLVARIERELDDTVAPTVWGFTLVMLIVIALTWFLAV